MSIAIRPAQSSNIEAIQTVAERAWYSVHAPIIGSETVEGFLDEYYDAESFQSRIDADAIILDIASDSGSNIVGYVLASPTEEEDATFSLSHIYVTPNRWRDGIGRQLLEHTEQKISHRGGEQIKLGVMAANDRAVNFYESTGYRRTSEFYDDRINTRGYNYVKDVG